MVIYPGLWFPPSFSQSKDVQGTHEYVFDWGYLSLGVLVLVSVAPLHSSGSVSCTVCSRVGSGLL